MTMVRYWLTRRIVNTSPYWRCAACRNLTAFCENSAAEPNNKLPFTINGSPALLQFTKPTNAPVVDPVSRSADCGRWPKLASRVRIKLTFGFKIRKNSRILPRFNYNWGAVCTPLDSCSHTYSTTASLQPKLGKLGDVYSSSDSLRLKARKLSGPEHALYNI